MAKSVSSSTDSAEYVAARSALNIARKNYYTVDARCYAIRQTARDACAIARAAYHNDPTRADLKIGYLNAVVVRSAVTASSHATAEVAFARLETARQVMLALGGMARY